MKNFITKSLIILLVIVSILILVTCNPEETNKAIPKKNVDSGDGGDNETSDGGTKGVESYIVSPIKEDEVLIGGETIHIDWYEFPTFVTQAIIELWGTLPTGESVFIEHLAYIDDFNSEGSIDYPIDNDFFVDHYNHYQLDGYKIIIKDKTSNYYEEGNIFTITPVIIDNPNLPSEDIIWQTGIEYNIDFRFSDEAITEGVDLVEVKLYGRNIDNSMWEELQQIGQINGRDYLIPYIRNGICEATVNWKIPRNLSTITDGLDINVDRFKVKIELYDVDTETEDKTLLVEGTSRGFIKIQYPVLTATVKVDTFNRLISHGYQESSKYKIYSTIIDGEMRLRTDILPHEKLKDIDDINIEIKNYSILTDGKRVQMFDRDTGEVLSDKTDNNDMIFMKELHLVNLYDINALIDIYNSNDDIEITTNNQEKLIALISYEGDTVELTYGKNMNTLDKIHSEQMLPMRGEGKEEVMVKTDMIFEYETLDGYIYTKSKITCVEYDMSVEEMIGEETALKMRSLYTQEDIQTVNSVDDIPQSGQTIPAPHADIVLSNPGETITIVNYSKETITEKSVLSRSQADCPDNSYFEFK